MRDRVIAFVLLATLLGFACPGLPYDANPEARSFPVQPGDSLSITNDSGKILIRPSTGTALDIKVLKTASDPLKGLPDISAKRNGNTIFVYSSSSGRPGETADLEIAAPTFLNVMISGASLEVEISGMEGTIRVQNSAGRIAVENTTSSLSLSSETGDILYKSSMQPKGDVRLETVSGSIHCEISSDFGLNSWVRAGGKIFWDMDPMVQAASMQKQLGRGGPLFYAASQKGDVIVRLIPASLPVPIPSAPVAMQLEATGTSPGQRTDHPQPLGTQAVASPSSSPSQPTPAVPAREIGRAEVKSPSQPAVSEPTTRSATPDAHRETPTTVASSPVLVQGDFSLKVDVDSVYLNASVREQASNRSIPGLRKEDFHVYEDGVPQQIEQFQPTEAPFNLLLLIDVSGSTASYLNLMKQAAIDFTKQINAKDRVAVATFNSSVSLVEGFTNDRSAAERAIQRIKSGGGTAFYDALMTCLDRYMRGIEGRSAIVVFTDGVDNQLEGRREAGSRTTYAQLYRKVQESDVIIYSIFLDTEGQVRAMSRGPYGRQGGGWPGGRRGGSYPGRSPFPFPLPMPAPNPGPYPSPSPYPSPNPYPRQREDEKAIYEEAKDQLLQIADQTGGRMYSPHRIDELSGVYSEIADDLRIQYQLGYNSTNRAHDGRWREIRVEVENHPDAVIRTRKGYYARTNATN